MNQLYFGDNLAILKSLYKQNPSGFIDLIYIDPPFNSKRNYNILFESVDLKNSIAQKEAFADTWTNVNYIDELSEIKEIDFNLFRFIESLSLIKVSTSAISYLTTMAIRIWYMHKLLKSTGSFYLHCDPTMSHYLKILCDLIFGDKNFINEISWKRSGRRSSMSKIYRKSHDVILFYSASPSYKFNLQFKPHDEKLLNKYTKKDKNGAYQLVPLMASGKRNGETGKPWHGFDPNLRGKGGMHWITVHSKLDEYKNLGLIEFPKNINGTPRLKYYLKDNKGVPIDDLWHDIDVINSMGKESLGYPTQKPVALMERIIEASSNEGDLVADFFCGCGTTIAAAHKLKRKWLGVDISHLAIKLISKRLVDNYGNDVIKTFEVHGFPKDIDSAKELASLKGGRLEFEEWIIEVMLFGVINQQRNKAGYDGYITLNLQGNKRVGFIEVKSGATSLSHLNHFIKTVEDNKVDFGIFVCFEENATKGMRVAAKKAGYFDQDSFKKAYDKIQIITVEQLLNNEMPNLPTSSKTTFKTAARGTLEKDTQTKFII